MGAISGWHIRNCPNRRAYSRPHRTRLTPPPDILH
jgi:hypothetical protein